jgi:hypothetical protein
MRLVREERGQVLIWAACLVSVAALLLVLVVDVGVLHVARAKLQAAADAAALAAVQESRPVFEFEVRPVVKEEFFPVGSALPDPEQTIEKKARYRTVEEWDPVAGEWVRRKELKGWDVRYVAAYEKEVKDAWLDLDWSRAASAAQEVMWRNALVWQREEEAGAGWPWIEDDEVQVEGKKVRYAVRVARMGVKTMLLGALLGQPDFMVVTVRDQEAEVKLEGR